MAVSSVEEFLAVLEKSKLLGPEQFADAERFAREARDPPTLVRLLVREKLISRWQSAQLIAGRTIFLLGRYKLIQLLGRGGMGSVFLAEHVTMNRRVALKIVPRHVGNDRASLERFFAEARAIAALDHPNIVRAYSVDNEYDRYFIVMEYVDGQDLQRMVEIEGPIEFGRAADYIRQAADGLAHAHARKMVHCDIKPSNLLVNTQGVVKILDLGLARLKGSDEETGAKPEDDVALGTVDYLAPEQALKTPDFDHRADIYSLGCTLYYLLTGHPPFPEGTLPQRIMKHQTQEPRGILEDRPDTPAALVEICAKMMAKKPDDRYQSADDVSRALAQWKPASRRSDSSGNPLTIAQPLEEESPAAEAGDEPGGETWMEPAGAATGAATAAAGKKAKATASKGGEKAKRGAVAVALAGIRAKLNTTRRKIVAGVAAATLALAAIAAATLPFVFGKSKPPEPEVSQAAGKAATDEDVGDKKSQKDEADKSDSADDEKPAQHKVKKKKKRADDDEEEEPVIVKKRKKKAKLDDDDETTEEPVAKTRAKPVAETAENAPEEKPGVKTENTAAAKTEPKAEAKPATKPEAKQQVKPKEPPKRVISLETLVAAADVPAPAHAEGPVSLGKLDLDPKDALDVKLLGGELVAKGNPKFDVQSEAAGDDPEWAVQEVQGQTTTKIARVWRDKDQELKFQWLPDAKERAGLVRNCGLLVSCADKQKFVALSVPFVVKDPLTVNLVTGASTVRLTRDMTLPDPGMLHLQVLPPLPLPKADLKVLEAKKGEPKSHEVKGHGHGRAKPAAEPVPGDTVSMKGRLDIVLNQEKTPPCGFHVTLEQKGSLAVTMKAYFDLGGQEWPFNKQTLQQAITFAQLSDPASNPAPKSGSKKKPPPPVPGAAEAAKLMKEQTVALSTLAGQLNGKAKIDFRVFALVSKPGDPTAHDVTLFQSRPLGEAPAAVPGVPAAPGGKPAARGPAAPGGKPPAGDQKGGLKL